MKKLLTTLAVLTVVATPAFAQGYDPAGTSIGAIHSEEFYTGAYAQDAANARAQAVPAVPKSAPRASTGVYNAQGNLIGADPDPNVRLQMRMDDVGND